MNPALWGLLTAFGWGGADFIARFTGRAMGHHAALFGMLLVGSLVLPLLLWLLDQPLTWRAEGWWLLLATGVGIMVATLLLYWGLARGPVTMVAPIVASYPAANLVLEFALGARPSGLQWAAMLAVMAGVVVVARSAHAIDHGDGIPRETLRGTIAISLCAALGFAVAVAAAQHATPFYGKLQTVAMARWISLAAICLVMLWRRAPLVMPLRWWPLIVLQGLLDGGAYIALVMAGASENAAIAAVVASCFAAITVVLARLILREAMTWPQWGGIVVIIGGVAMLSAG